MPTCYCIFSTQYRPTVGGVENHTHYLAEKIVQQGDKALVVTSALPGLPLHEVSASGIEVFRLPSFLLAGGRLPLVRQNATTRRLVQDMLRHRPQRIVIQTRLYPLCLLAARLARKHSIPAIVIEHGFAYTTTGNPIIDTGLKVYTQAMLKAVYRKCPRFYAVSQSSADWLAGQGIPVRGLLHNAISINAVEAAHQAPHRQFRREYALPDGALVAVYAGRLIAEKGVLQLVQAVKAYNQRNKPPLYLFAAGEGALYQQLQNDSSPFILAPGALDFANVVALLETADIFCLPTGLPEGFPSSALEAGACGTFVMGTAMGGLREMIPDESFGLLLPDNQPDTLLAGLLRAAENRPYRQQAAKAFRQRVLEQYTYDALYKQLANADWGDVP